MPGFAGPVPGEERRAPWVALGVGIGGRGRRAGRPEFRAVLSACLEWASRTALALSPAAAPPAQAAVPRWDWEQGGSPTLPAPAEGEVDDTDATLPAPDQQVSFAAHIKPLFRERDRQSMSFAFDLWSFEDVSSRATGILGRLRAGSMPCDGAWPAAKVEVFQRWVDSGLQP